MNTDLTLSDSQDKRLVRTYTLRASTVQRLKALVADTDAFDSHLVDILLHRALAEVAAGRWKIHRRPVKFEVELQ